MRSRARLRIILIFGAQIDKESKALKAIWKVPSGTSESSPTLQGRGQVRLSPYGTEAVTEGRAFCLKFRVIFSECGEKSSEFREKSLKVRVICSTFRENNSEF